jgi:hypothetical protein
MNAFTKFATNDLVRLAVLYAALFATVAAGAAPANAAEIEDAGPVFSAGSHYSAVYHQSRGEWQILPVNGQDLAVDTGDCATGTVHPKGVWLVTRDDQGRVQLLAPSTTPLPAGAADTIAVRACDAPEAGALVLPQPLIDLLASESGAVLIDD